MLGQVLDFTSINDDLEAESTISSSTRTLETHTDKDIDDAFDLQPRVGEIEQELKKLKERLEEGIAGMDALRRELFGLDSTRPSQSSQGRINTIIENGVDEKQSRHNLEPTKQRTEVGATPENASQIVDGGDSESGQAKGGTLSK